MQIICLVYRLPSRLMGMKFYCLLAALFLTVQLHAEDNPNVSTLNNQLVKVGDRNEYLYEIKPFNVMIDPIGVIVGSYEVSGSYAFHPNVAAKIGLNYMYEPYGVHLKGFGTTVAFPVYFRKVYSGLFLEPGISFSSVSETNGNKSATAIGPQMLVGWHWYWDSGLNFALAGGVQRNFTGKDYDGAISNYSKFRFTGFFTAGWAF